MTGEGRHGRVGIRNTDGSETVNVFSDNGSANPGYERLLPGEFSGRGTAAIGERITLQVQGNYAATIEAFSAHRTDDNRCHVQARAPISEPKPGLPARGRGPIRGLRPSQTAQEDRRDGTVSVPR